MLRMTGRQPEEISVKWLAAEVFFICICLPALCIVLECVHAHRTGFFCSDVDISYPFKPSTISQRTCFSISFVLPIIIVVSAERLLAGAEGAAGEPVRVGERELPRWAARALRVVLAYVYGYCATLIMSRVAKLSVGRLRPHFFAVCRPDAGALCDPNAAPGRAPLYVDTYNCAAEHLHIVREVSTSFPSSHSSVSTYAAFFIVLFLDRHARWPQRWVVAKTALQVMAMTAAWYVSLTRISDNKHHWGDVLAGSALGAAIAAFWVRSVVKAYAGVGELRDTSAAT